jgi:hypothetical protein
LENPACTIASTIESMLQPRATLLLSQPSHDASTTGIELPTCPIDEILHQLAGS